MIHIFRNNYISFKVEAVIFISFFHYKLAQLQIAVANVCSLEENYHSERLSEIKTRAFCELFLLPKKPPAT